MPQHSVVVQTCPLSTREIEAELRLLGAQGQPDLYSKFQASQRYTVRKKKVVSNSRHISFNIHSELSLTFIPTDRWPNCLREVKEHVQSK